MKKIFILSLFLVLSAAFVKAQVVIKPSVGLNFTDWSKDPGTGEYNARPGYQLGAAFRFGKKLFIEPGIYYVRKSTEFVSSGGGSNQQVDYDLKGLRIPLSVGVNIIGNPNTAFGLRAFGGGSAFFLMNTSSSNSIFEKDNLNNASFGAFAGLGVDIAILFAELSYEWSLTNVGKDINQIDVGKKRSLFANAGVRIPL